MWFAIEVGILNGTELLLDFNTMLSLKSEFIFVFDFQWICLGQGFFGKGSFIQPKPFQDCWRLLKAFKKLIFFTLLVAMQAASNFLNVAITFWFLVPYIPLACHLKQKVFVLKEMKTIGIVCKLLQ